MIKKIVCNREDLARAVARQNELIFAHLIALEITTDSRFVFVFELDDESSPDDPEKKGDEE